MIRECKKHGLTEYSIYGIKHKKYVCKKCNVEFVTKRRRDLKKKLVEHFGGCCILCGYNKCISALNFHHIDPTEKEFDFSSRGLTRSYDRLLVEANKCILVCANCHAEIHHNLVNIGQ